MQALLSSGAFTHLTFLSLKSLPYAYEPGPIRSFRTLQEIDAREPGAGRVRQQALIQQFQVVIRGGCYLAALAPCQTIEIWA